MSSLLTSVFGNALGDFLSDGFGRSLWDESLSCFFFSPAHLQLNSSTFVVMWVEEEEEEWRRRRGGGTFNGFWAGVRDTRLKVKLDKRIV